MKLYTEEQLKQIFANIFDFTGYDYKIEDYTTSITPIELPSDEYIDEVFQPMTELNQFYKDGFINGTKWMKEQILNQNK